MARKIARTIEAFNIHGHMEPGSEEEVLINYQAFFNDLAQLPALERRTEVGANTVAITEAKISGPSVALHFVTGNAEDSTLVYDSRTATAEAVDLGANRLMVSGAWLIAYPDSRILFLERKRPGVPILEIESCLSQLGQLILGVDRLSISINPVTSSSFEEEIRKLTRIREAAITLRRPNHSWTASASSLLGELGSSNAATVEMQLNADRGQSLSKDSGIVGEIIQLVKRPVHALKNARVKGISSVDETERSISMTRHTMKATAKVNSMADPLEQLDDLRPVSEALISDINSMTRLDDVEEN